MASSSNGRRPYELRAGPLVGDELLVVSFSGTESISALFSYDLVVQTTHEWNELSPMLLSHTATLVITETEPPRVVQGIVAKLEYVGLGHAAGETLREYRMRVVPRMWLLRRRKTTRIFQDVTLADVFAAVLGQSGVAHRWALTAPLPRRSYCLQYEETDYAFVRRLCAEEGIYFYFEQPSGLLDGATGGLGSAVAAGVAEASAIVATIGSSFGGAAGDALGDAAGAVAGAATAVGATGLTETVVFATGPTGYLPLGGGASELASAGLSAFTSAVTSLPGMPGVAGDVVGAVASLPHTPGRAVRYVERKGAEQGDVEVVYGFTMRGAVRTNRTELRDYDFKKPLYKMVGRSGKGAGGAAGSALDAVKDVASAAVNTGFNLAPIEGAAISEVSKVTQPALEMYDHRGDYEEQDASNPVAAVHLEQYRAGALVGRGESSCRGFAPGIRFTLVEHPEEALNQEYVVTEMRCTGTIVHEAARVSYENRFRCAPAYVAWRPRRRRPRVQQVLETAVVTGPPGEEIYTDEFGRVKVRFHWDRTGQGHEHSSCWIRVSHAWAGAAWGFQFVPRIGMEVLVSFIGGDADRPMILGAAYNATHPVPFLLPNDKTQSGIRTQSSPGGDGFNELSFEDAKGRERIYVHAQRDLDELVLRDHTLHVQADETLRIDANRRDTVVKDVTYEVHGNRTETVHGDTSVRHVGARLDVVERSLDQRVTGARTTRVEDRDDLEVRGPTQQQHQADVTTRVMGNQTVIVGKHEAPRSLTLRVEGVGSISAEGVLELASAKGITLRCGKTTLRIGEDGIELVGGMIRVAGEKGGLEAGKDGVKLKADGVYAHLGDQLLVKTDKASLSMGSEVKLDGQQILLNSPSSGKDKPPPDPKPPTEIALKDTDGNPLANQRFVIELDDGTQRMGVTDKDGKAKMDLPSGGKIRFPDLTDVKSS